jgi:LysR family glycine cleavage system transcriptional activator
MSQIHGESPVPRWTPPPISAVRALEAAARLNSFTLAAEELCVTQSAVSHSVRQLERRLGVDLFRRGQRGLELSDAGRSYLSHAAEALTRLRAADDVVVNPNRRARILTVSMSPSFAAKWLAPRLGSFSTANPDLDLRVSATPQHVDFTDGEIDMAVRHGDGNWPNLDCTRLCTETVFPAMHPSHMMERVLQTPADLLSCTLIHHRGVDAWRTWLDSFGVAAPARSLSGPQFSEMSLAIDAAVAGQGVALVRSALAERDVREGRLVRPIPHEVPALFAYWIVCPRSVAGTQKIVRFRDWLLAQAAPGHARQSQLHRAVGSTRRAAGQRTVVPI